MNGSQTQPADPGELSASECAVAPATRAKCYPVSEVPGNAKVSRRVDININEGTGLDRVDANGDLRPKRVQFQRILLSTLLPHAKRSADGHVTSPWLARHDGTIGKNRRQARLPWRARIVCVDQRSIID